LDAPFNARYWTEADKKSFLAIGGLSAYDPTATLSLHCPTAPDGAFNPLVAVSNA